jgi:hypothetical protein
MPNFKAQSSNKTEENVKFQSSDSDQTKIWNFGN